MAVLVDREDEYCVVLFVEAAPERKNATVIGIGHGKKDAGEWKRTWYTYYRGDLSR